MKHIFLLMVLLVCPPAVQAGSHAADDETDLAAARNFDTGGFDFQIARCPVKPSALALGMNSETVTSVGLLGNDCELNWQQNAHALAIQPAMKWASQHAVAFENQLKSCQPKL